MRVFTYEYNQLVGYLRDAAFHSEGRYRVYVGKEDDNLPRLLHPVTHNQEGFVPG